MTNVANIVQKFPYVSMDTEFPGVVVHPLGNYAGSSNHTWRTIQCNVNILKIIQLGLTFSDEEGNRPRGVCTWQFNFIFDIDSDMYAQDSIELLDKCGIDFHLHLRDGIDSQQFAEFLMSSGLVLTDDVTWLSFHSGYDYGYILKLLTNQELPEDENEFLSLLDTYFARIYDVKYIVKCDTTGFNHKNGLSSLAEELGVERIGPKHQAGSDSLLTCMAFFQLQSEIRNEGGEIDEETWRNVLYGLGRDLL
eukprot:TRINITY_DN17471_c0_g1_i2.p1 TRINITY_DN17471_c0_g1~~TRINITY_DN17471_c0_g1_i2.p1  ORF type:complete len:282 (-),score=33.66 TRINITY_DN17471_c0_g1_i2:79-828(-)